MLYKYLFPQYCNSYSVSVILLILRLFFGIMMIIHGIEKLDDFAVLSTSFPNVLWMGSRTTLLFVIFVEVVCGLAFLFGFMYRLILLPLIVTMLVAFGSVHHWSVIQGELSFIYLFIFVFCIVAGPGRYSIDYLISSYIFYVDDVALNKQSANMG